VAQMKTIEQLNAEIAEAFPVGARVRLSPRGKKFSLERFHKRKGIVKEYREAQTTLKGEGARTHLFIEWEDGKKQELHRSHVEVVKRNYPASRRGVRELSAQSA